MQIAKIVNNPQTAFKASLPKKTRKPISGDCAYDFWDTFAGMCEKEGNLPRLQKCLKELQNVEKGKILAFDKYIFENPSTAGYGSDYYLGIFDSQENLEKARKRTFWDDDLVECIKISGQELWHEITHRGKTTYIDKPYKNSKIDSKFFLDILETMIKNLKENTEGTKLINKFRMK